MHINTQHSTVVAALGPTNTGKTYLAFDRMLGHGSGIMGFPLRLLARENYEKAAAIKGFQHVALITGEEKIVPPHAKYFFCTVESMPTTKHVDFLAVDEIQMCCDPDRGHIFTDRLLNARGRKETMFMGAGTIAYLIKQLVPEIKIVSRQRFSTLTYSGSKKIIRLAPRSAVVGFSASNVYAVAELIRRQRGGAAIVMGALSPRTRNAQVNLFQNGDVDYLVATDAIGMGLNMDVNHIAFSAVHKFDGKVHRELLPIEMSQIAGRAGRHMSDGTFGVTGDAETLSPEMVEAIEQHRFKSSKFFYWRNRELNFASFDDLLASLDCPPGRRELVRIDAPPDERFLRELSQDSEISSKVSGTDDIRLIWGICQVPDFRGSVGSDHTRLLRRIFWHLKKSSCLPGDWISKEIVQLNRSDGDIDTLLGRIAGIRIWTYISHRDGWLEDPTHWQEKTREVEDNLSDTLHQKLTQRFVDQRTALLVKRLKDQKTLYSVVDSDGHVMVEGQFIGKLKGLRFVADATDNELAGKAVRVAALRALGREIPRRVQMLVGAPNKMLSLTNMGRVVWLGDDIARLVEGPDPFSPNLSLTCDDSLDPTTREKLEKHVKQWTTNHIRSCLKPFFNLKESELKGAARGIVFQLQDRLGFLPKRVVAKQIRRLTKEDHRILKSYGVRIGYQEIFLPTMLRPKAAALLGLLWAVSKGMERPPSHLIPSLVSLPFRSSLNIGFCNVIGFRRRGPLLLRVDILERLIGQIRRRLSKGPFVVDAELLNLAGCDSEKMDGILRALGYRGTKKDGIKTYDAQSEGDGRRVLRQFRGKTVQSLVGSRTPFSKLRDLPLRS